MFLIICWTSSYDPDRRSCRGQKKKKKKETKRNKDEESI